MKFPLLLLLLLLLLTSEIVSAFRPIINSQIRKVNGAMFSFKNRYHVRARISFSVSSSNIVGIGNTDLPIRPSLDDVEKISYGQAAKRRGIGSRGVPHRLNSEERLEWDLAKKRKFLVLRGTGFRKERGDSPLANSWRNWADATGCLAISIQRSNDDKGPADSLIVDFSPLRTTINLDLLSKEIQGLASKYDSISSIEDTNMQTTGFSNYEISLIEHAIWTIPVTGVFITFKNRKDAKLLAQEIADKYCMMK